MKKEVTLYNMIFPLWIFFLFPLAWPVILPANFLIDSLVFLIALFVLRIEGKKAHYKKYILRIWGYGFLADIIGAALLAFFLFFGYFEKHYYAYNPLADIPSFLIVTLGVVLAGVCIFFFNYHKVLADMEEDARTRKIIALILALLTAPYTMYLPTEWFI